MDKYNEFINEGKEDIDFHVSRLQALVDMALPLMDQINKRSDALKKYKRAHEAIRHLNIEWNEIFPPPKKKEKGGGFFGDLLDDILGPDKKTNKKTNKPPQPKRDSRFQIGYYYVYDPDKNVLPKGPYRKWKGYVVQLIGINRDRNKKILVGCDTGAFKYVSGTDYLVKVPNSGIVYDLEFYTRGNCLTGPIPKPKGITDNIGTEVGKAVRGILGF